MPSPWPGSLSAFLGARPGPATSQPSPRHWPARPGARAHAEGRGLAAFPKAPRSRASCLRGKPREIAEKGDVAWVSSLADQVAEKKVPLSPGPGPHPTLAEVRLSAGPVPSTQETNFSSAPCILGIQAPLFHASPFRHQAQGSPKFGPRAGRLQLPTLQPQLRRSALWTDTWAHPASSLSHLRLPRCSLTPDPAETLLQERAERRTKSERGGKAMGPSAPGASSPRGAEWLRNERGAAVRLVRPGGTAWVPKEQEAAGSRCLRVPRLT